MAKGWAIKGAAASWWVAGQVAMGAAYLCLLPDLLANIAGSLKGGAQAALVKSVYEGTFLEGSAPHVAGVWIKRALATTGLEAGWGAALMALGPLLALFALSGALSAASKKQARRLWGKGEREHEKMRDGERRALAEREELERVAPAARGPAERSGQKGRL